MGVRKLHMRQSYKIIPIYTADVSGVCSALYELGGMVVMHDPSGCNSTYNTHDEIRWYDQDSLIYISGLTEIDAVMGNDAKFIHDIEEAAKELKPKFIALAGSPIPFMNGTDFPAIAQVVKTETGIPAFAVPTNGMHDYTYGAGLALARLAERFVKEPGVRAATSDIDRNSTYSEVSRIRPHTLNFLGVTPLDFGPQANVDAMKQTLRQCGWEVISTWAMGDTLEDLSHAGEAEINLVVSAVGLPTAKLLQEKFGTPYIIGTPIGGFTEELIQEINEKVSHHNEAEEADKNNLSVAYLKNRLAGTPQITLIGEAVTMGSLAAALEKQYNKPVRVICPLETHEGLLAPNDCTADGEEEMEQLLKDAGILFADPLYRPICPPDSTFIELPHIAFSGRIFLKKIKKCGIFGALSDIKLP